MSARGKGFGKGGKAGGKAAYLSKRDSARHRSVLRDPLRGLEKRPIRNLARRSGVKRIAGDVYGATRNVAKDFLEVILHDAIAFTASGDRRTVSVRDVLAALQRNGRAAYGY